MQYQPLPQPRRLTRSNMPTIAVQPPAIEQPARRALSIAQARAIAAGQQAVVRGVQPLPPGPPLPPLDPGLARPSLDPAIAQHPLAALLLPLLAQLRPHGPRPV